MCFALLGETGGGFDFIPCMNIDGVMLCKYGAEWIEEQGVKDYLYKINGAKRDFSLWKANAYAVDLNVNFDAGWGTGRQNLTYPSPANYIGTAPGSEPETQALVSVLGKNNYSQVVCYHTKGEVVYWGFGSNFFHYEEAERYAKKLGYLLLTSEGSAGGLKDYYDTVSQGLGLTVEVGEDIFPHPYPVSELDNLVKRHLPSMEILYENGVKIAAKVYGNSPGGSSQGI